MDSEEKKQKNRLIRVGLVLDEETWQRFKTNVLAKYGRSRGVLGCEVDKALQSWLTGVPVQGPTRSHANKLDHFIQIIKSGGRKEYTDKELIAILSAKIGLNDYRSHRNYLKGLVASGHATCRAGMYNMIYTLNYDKE